MNEPTFTIQTDAYGNRWIRCLRCGMGSYNPNDIEQKYCGACHIFHAELNPDVKSEKPVGGKA